MFCLLACWPLVVVGMDHLQARTVSKSVGDELDLVVISGERRYDLMEEEECRDCSCELHFLFVFFFNTLH